MEKQKKDVINWIKTHKKELIIAGVSVTAIVAAILCYKNWESIEKLWLSLIKKVDNIPVKTEIVDTVEVLTPVAVTVVEPEIEVFVPVLRESPQFPFEVCDHIRNLPEGWHASPEKIATAAEHGFNLLPGQTWVENYTKVAQSA